VAVRAASAVRFVPTRKRRWVILRFVSVGGTPTVKDARAGVASVLPDASVAATARRWTPSLRPGVVYVGPHGAAAPPSSWQAKVEPGSSEAKPNATLATCTLPVTGPDVIDVSGATSGHSRAMTRRYRCS